MTVRLIGLSTLCSLLLVGAASAAAPAQSLGIKLQDSSTDPSIVHMRMVLDQNALKPGRVTIQAENQSKTLVHEVMSCAMTAPRNSRLTPSTTR